MSVTRVGIVPVGRVDPAILEFLALTLPASLGAPCDVVRDALEAERAYRAERQQYHSTEILARLVQLPASAGGTILGVTAVDLFIPVLTFVFGEAQLGGRAALFSLHRLRQSYYGLPDDERLLLERCEKEALHELGHATGLVHCAAFDCVMHFSNSIEQVDLKVAAFCEECARRREGLTRLRSGIC